MALVIKNKSYLQAVSISPKGGTLEGAKLSEAFDSVGNGVNAVADQIAANPNGGDTTPPNISNFTAQHLGSGHVDFAITDNGQVKRAINYVVEVASNSGFSGSRVVHFSPSRNSPGTLTLPNGSYWMKAYSQYQLGGPPSKPIITGPVVVTGSATGALLPTQGAGVALPGSTGEGAGLKSSR